MSYGYQSAKPKKPTYGGHQAPTVHQGATGYQPSPPVSSPPVDPQWLAQQNAANLNIGLGDAWDTYQGGKIDAAYGNTDDPTADLSTNPYSQAALLQKSYLNQKRASLNSYAAQGQLYAGSYQNRVEADAEGYNQQLDSLRKAKSGAQDDLLKGKLDRYGQVGASLSADQLNAIKKALGV